MIDPRRIQAAEGATTGTGLETGPVGAHAPRGEALRVLDRRVVPAPRGGHSGGRHAGSNPAVAREYFQPPQPADHPEVHPFVLPALVRVEPDREPDHLRRWLRGRLRGGQRLGLLQLRQRLAVQLVQRQQLRRRGRRRGRVAEPSALSGPPLRWPPDRPAVRDRPHNPVRPTAGPHSGEGNVNESEPVIRYVCGAVCRSRCPVCAHVGISRHSFDEMVLAMERHGEAKGHGWTKIRWRER